MSGLGKVPRPATRRQPTGRDARRRSVPGIDRPRHPATHRRGGAMSTSLVFYGTLGLVSTAVAFWANRRLFSGGRAGPVDAARGALLRPGAHLAWAWGGTSTSATSSSTATRPPTWPSPSRCSPSGRRTRRPRTTSWSTWCCSPVDDHRRPAAGAGGTVDLLRDEPVHQPGLLPWPSTWPSSSASSATTGPNRPPRAPRSRSCSRG